VRHKQLIEAESKSKKTSTKEIYTNNCEPVFKMQWKSYEERDKVGLFRHSPSSCIQRKFEWRGWNTSSRHSTQHFALCGRYSTSRRKHVWSTKYVE